MNKKLTREYLHSISRISDRLKIVNRDIKMLKNNIIRDLNNIEEDLIMLSNGFDSFFNDLVEDAHNYDDIHEVEEI